MINLLENEAAAFLSQLTVIIFSFGCGRNEMNLPPNET
jgi:hypothetical protein